MLDTLPKEMLLYVASYLPPGGMPTKALLLMGAVCKNTRNCVRAKLNIQIHALHGTQYKRVKQSYARV